MNKSYIAKNLQKTNQMLALMQQDQMLIDAIDNAIELIYNSFKSKGKILFAGNGGSAADAQHMSAEFVSRFLLERPGLPSIALTTDTSALTAIGNDYGFEQLFARQIEALGRAEDVLIAYSTSGTSPNILKGLQQAKTQGLSTIGLTGIKKQSQVMAELCDITIRIPSESTPYIQEGHLMVGHILCGAVEKKLYP
jgi:D-sedoheptulose 7-phosphate isomerase